MLKNFKKGFSKKGSISPTTFPGFYWNSPLQSRKNKKTTKTANHPKQSATLVKHVYIYIYFRSLDQGRGGRHGGHGPSFSEIAFCQECFLRNSLLCHYPRHPKHFWPRHSQNFVGGLYSVWKNSFDLASSGYGYSYFPLTDISSQL